MPSGPTCTEPVRSVVRAGFEKRDRAAVAPADVVICSCWEADGFCAGRLGAWCHAVRCGACGAGREGVGCRNVHEDMNMCINVFFLPTGMRAAGEMLMLVLRGSRS